MRLQRKMFNKTNLKQIQLLLVPSGSADLFKICLTNPFKNKLISFQERQSVSWGGEEREGDTVSEAGSRLQAVSTEPDVRLEPTNCRIMT